MTELDLPDAVMQSLNDAGDLQVRRQVMDAIELHFKLLDDQIGDQDRHLSNDPSIRKLYADMALAVACAEMEKAIAAMAKDRPIMPVVRAYEALRVAAVRDGATEH